MNTEILRMVTCGNNNQMQYWLLKSEPNVWSIDNQIKAGSKGADWECYY